MARKPVNEIKQYEKLLMLLISNRENDTGRPVPVAEIKEILADDIQLSRLAVYNCQLKSFGFIVRSIKNGRNVVAYQLVNVDTAIEHLSNRGFLSVQTNSQILESEEV